ncbi:unnamed protein product [Chrysoparadoxa australica]
MNKPQRLGAILCLGAIAGANAFTLSAQGIQALGCSRRSHIGHSRSVICMAAERGPGGEESSADVAQKLAATSLAVGLLLDPSMPAFADGSTADAFASLEKRLVESMDTQSEASTSPAPAPARAPSRKAAASSKKTSTSPSSTTAQLESLSSGFKLRDFESKPPVLHEFSPNVKWQGFKPPPASKLQFKSASEGKAKYTPPSTPAVDLPLGLKLPTTSDYDRTAGKYLNDLSGSLSTIKYPGMSSEVREKLQASLPPDVSPEFAASVGLAIPLLGYALQASAINTRRRLGKAQRPPEPTKEYALALIKKMEPELASLLAQLSEAQSTANAIAAEVKELQKENAEIKSAPNTAVGQPSKKLLDIAKKTKQSTALLAETLAKQAATAAAVSEMQQDLLEVRRAVAAKEVIEAKIAQDKERKEKAEAKKLEEAKARATLKAKLEAEWLEKQAAQNRAVEEAKAAKAQAANEAAEAKKAAQAKKEAEAKKAADAKKAAEAKALAAKDSKAYKAKVKEEAAAAKAKAEAVEAEASSKLAKAAAEAEALAKAVVEKEAALSEAAVKATRKPRAAKAKPKAKAKAKAAPKAKTSAKAKKAAPKAAPKAEAAASAISEWSALTVAQRKRKTVAQLKAFLEAEGQSTTGLKGDLVGRVEELIAR